ncbi:YodC family protein [Aeromonas rivipollensis]|uniref:YodC family protein n=1 Tax=Aeromonas rivipollensis TaxID=948519 RepID=UPI0038CF6CEA
MSNFNVGAIVRLKSGGPMMTVTGRNYDSNCICVWFDSMKEYSGVYPDEALYSEAEVKAQAEQARRESDEEIRRISASLNNY